MLFILTWHKSILDHVPFFRQIEHCFSPPPPSSPAPTLPPPQPPPPAPPSPAPPPRQVSLLLWCLRPNVISRISIPIEPRPSIKQQTSICADLRSYFSRSGYDRSNMIEEGGSIDHGGLCLPTNNRGSNALITYLPTADPSLYRKPPAFGAICAAPIINVFNHSFYGTSESDLRPSALWD